MINIEEYEKFVEGIESTKLSDIVNLGGKYYLVDSVLTLDTWYETVVYRCDKYCKNVNWNEVYVEHHHSFEQMKLRHKYIVKNLKELLK